MKIEIELPENATNGDMIKAIFNPYKICEYEYSVHVYMTEEDFWKADFQMNYDTSWWDTPYKGDYSLKQDLSRELLIRDIQHGKSGEECMTNFSHNLLRENMEEDSITEEER